MAKRKPTFNFGANAKPRKTKGAKGGSGKGKGGGGKTNAWRAYTSGSSALIPD